MSRAGVYSARVDGAEASSDYRGSAARQEQRAVTRSPRLACSGTTYRNGAAQTSVRDDSEERCALGRSRSEPSRQAETSVTCAQDRADERPHVRSSEGIASELRRRRSPRMAGMATTEDPRARCDATDEWREELYDAKPERQGELFSTISGLENEPLVHARHASRSTTTATSAIPGVYPVHARRLSVDVPRASSGRCGSSPASARRRRRTSASATCSSTARPGLSTAFDMPTLMGYDSDHAALARRGRPRGRGDRLARRHGDALRAGSRSARSRRR